MRFNKYLINEIGMYQVGDKRYSSFQEGWWEYSRNEWPAIKKRIKRECQPWLSAIKKCHNRVIFRGVRGKDQDADLHFAKPIRKSRKPLDTSRQYSKILDDGFEDAFGWRPRSQSMFAVKDYSVASSYGTAYMVFPVGKFRFLWSFEIPDLYGGIAKHSELIIRGDEHHRKRQVEAMKKWYSEEPKALCRALNAGGEIMIGASHYRAVSFRVAMNLRDYVRTQNEYGDEVYQFENAWDQKGYDKFIEGEFF